MNYGIALLLCLATTLPAAAQWGKVLQGLGGKTSSSDKTGAGLKEALRVGTEHAVGIAGVQDGFFRNAAIRILLPEKVKKVEKGLRMVGLGCQVDAFELSMNRAAEKAAPAARQIFIDAVKEMTFDDARRILTGGGTSATDFFRAKTTPRLTAAFRPIIDKAMDETGVVRQYKSLAGGLSALPFGLEPQFNLTDYVTGKTLDGLFFLVAEEEKKIRTDPLAQITPLLREVFGRK